MLLFGAAVPARIMALGNRNNSRGQAASVRRRRMATDGEQLISHYAET